jgi:cell division transport system permease protein
MPYHVRQALLAMRGNLTAVLATLTTMTLTLTLLGLVTLTSLNLERTIRSVEEQVEVWAYLKDPTAGGSADARNERVLRVLQDMDAAESTTYVPKEQALSELAMEYGYLNDARGLVSNPLPDAFRIRLKSPRFAQPVAQRLRTLPEVDEVEAGEDFAEKAANAFDIVRYGGAGLVVLLLLNTLFNILNTIRVAMYARRDEINVMRLIGATRGFIRAPYVLEGAGLGLIAGLITAAIVYPVYTITAGRLRDLAPFLPVATDPLLVLQVIGAVAALGVLLGLIGSFFAANRYLREVE